VASVQLRRYQLSANTLAEWVAHWREDVVSLREAYGFHVLFAYADHVNDQFVWAVSYEGSAEELAARDREYHACSEWEKANAGKNGPILRTTISVVEDVRPPRA
jgi:hypothetical protein